jgi:lipoprotein-anchoring transpeptidase ErfK/SrfK
MHDIFAAVFAANALMGVAIAQEAPPVPAPLTGDAVNSADLSLIPAQYAPPGATEPTAPAVPTDPAAPIVERPPLLPDAAVTRLQILLDRAGASPGVIDGFDGDNVRKAVMAFEAMRGLPVDGILDPEMLAQLASPEPVVGQYTIMAEDQDGIVGPLPRDYSELARLPLLGYSDMREKLGERFHMDVDLLSSLNPGSQFAVGETIVVAAYGPDRSGEVASIEADKTLRQVRAYGADGALIAAYPATIGSEDNPSPSGVHEVLGVAPDPTYTYNPAINFQQGSNTEVLVLPPGPNGPVGSVWIDLSEPTFGIHGTPEPSFIDKTGSHGCVRLTNWDATELAAMVKPGVTVTFTGG